MRANIRLLFFLTSDTDAHFWLGNNSRKKNRMNQVAGLQWILLTHISHHHDHYHHQKTYTIFETSRYAFVVHPVLFKTKVCVFSFYWRCKGMWWSLWFIHKISWYVKKFQQFLQWKEHGCTHMMMLMLMMCCTRVRECSLFINSFIFWFFFFCSAHQTTAAVARRQWWWRWWRRYAAIEIKCRNRCRRMRAYVHLLIHAVSFMSLIQKLCVYTTQVYGIFSRI